MIYDPPAQATGVLWRARAHERFKPLAFIAAQPNQVFFTAISFRPRINSIALRDDRDSEKRHRINDAVG
jgi:hypothetical protein